MKKQILLVAAAVLLLIGCTPATPPDVTDTTVAEAPAPDVQLLGGAQLYTIIRPEAADDALVTDVLAFRQAIVDRCPAIEAPDLSSDWASTPDAIGAYEILIGQTEREESLLALTDLRYNDFTVRMVGEKLVILGGTDAKTKEAMDYFLTNCVTAEGSVLPADFSYVSRGEYTYDSVSIAGVPLSNYHIIYANKADTVAKTLSRTLGEVFGYALPVSASNRTEESEYEIVLGSTDRKKFNKAAFYAYSIIPEGSRIYINAYDEYAYEVAFTVLRDALIAADGKLSDIASLAAEYTLPDRQAYIENPELLYMRWALRHEYAPDWMTDWDTRKATLSGQITSPSLLACAHRADLQYYPENSIEAIISAYFAGVGVLELDFRCTKDNVLILMHDDGLTRTTNAADYVGKPGYPTTDKVSDWTYAQIQTLYLKEGKGREGADLTGFRVTTLTEALMVCKNRMFIWPDIKEDKIAHIGTDAQMASSGKVYIWDSLVEANNYESIFISLGTSLPEHAAIQRQIASRSGVTPFVYKTNNPSTIKSSSTTLSRLCPAGTVAHNINQDFDMTAGAVDTYASIMRDAGNYFIGTRTTTVELTDINNYDNWTAAINAGVDMIMTNYPHELLDLILELHD